MSSIHSYLYWVFDSFIPYGLLACIGIVFFWYAIKFGITGFFHKYFSHRFPRIKHVLEQSNLFRYMLRGIILGGMFFGFQYFLISDQVWVTIIENVLFVGLMLTLFQIIQSIINIVLIGIQDHFLVQSLLFKTAHQVVQLVLFLLFLIIIISSLIDKSPFIILSSLGAFTAVLLLIFKDTILGFVASIQVSILGIVKEGDWIEMPAYHADGTIIDIHLTSIRVQNWDKTISTIPTYALVSEPLKNWRGMEESKARRIKRSLLIDIQTIKLCDDSWIDTLKKKLNFDCSHLKNTNIGLFRQYANAYLKNHPEINQSMTILVRQLQSTQNGLPIEIYCFTTTTDWNKFESIQSDIFDHFISVLGVFDLSVFQYSTELKLQSN